MNESMLDRLAIKLVDQKVKFVFAESCTSGLLSATLSKISGVSEFLCGSFATYRNQSKIDWLGVCADVIERETAVCETVANQMATGALNKTIEAEWSASVTGHLGPGAPAEQDGQIFVGIGKRVEAGPPNSADPVAEVIEHRLRETTRLSRQNEAAEFVLEQLIKAIEQSK